MLTPADYKEIKINSIVQISPEEDHGTKLQFGVVTSVESWGVRMRLHNGGVISRTWNLIEQTGGMAVFDNFGQRLEEPKPTSKHHP